MNNYAALLNFHKYEENKPHQTLFNANSLKINNEYGIKIEKNKNSSNDKIHLFENEKVLVIFQGYLLNIEPGKEAEYVGIGYVLNGKSIFSSLDGSFSISLIDKENNDLYLLVDPFGKVNMYYSISESSLFFSTTLNDININAFTIKKVNHEAITDLFSYYFIPAPLTIYEKVYKMLPSELIYYSFQEKKIKTEKYWNIKLNKEVGRDFKENIRNKIIQNVERLKNKFNINSSFLSGGVDSTIISGILAELSNQPINTFTVGYKDNKIIDESDLTKKISKHHQSNHHILYLQASDLAKEYREIIAKLDEPFADSSMIPTYFISKHAFNCGQLDLLSGDGGDELFAGYNRYDSIRYSQMYNNIPHILRKKIIEPISYRMPQKSNSKVSDYNNKFKKLLSTINGTPFEIYHRFLLALSVEELDELLENGRDNCLTLKKIKEQYHYLSNSNEVEKMMYADLFFNLPNDVLYKVMKMSELNKIKTHSPLLEKSLVNMSFSVPLNYKINNKDKKIIFKEIFEEHLPKEVLSAPKKGFGVPINEWFREELKDDFLSSVERNKEILEEYLNYEVLMNYINEHMTYINDYSHLLWTVFVFCIWLEENL